MGNKVPTDVDYPKGVDLSAVKGQQGMAAGMDNHMSHQSMSSMPGMDMGPLSFDCNGNPVRAYVHAHCELRVCPKHSESVCACACV